MVPSRSRGPKPDPRVVAAKRLICFGWRPTPPLRQRPYPGPMRHVREDRETPQTTDALRITLGNQAAKHPPVSFAKRENVGDDRTRFNLSR